MDYNEMRTIQVWQRQIITILAFSGIMGCCWPEFVQYWITYCGKLLPETCSDSTETCRGPKRLISVS